MSAKRPALHLAVYTIILGSICRQCSAIYVVDIGSESSMSLFCAATNATDRSALHAMHHEQAFFIDTIHSSASVSDARSVKNFMRLFNRSSTS